MACGCNHNHAYSKESAIMIAGCMAKTEKRNYIVYEGLMGWNFAPEIAEIVKKFPNTILIDCTK